MTLNNFLLYGLPCLPSCNVPLPYHYYQPNREQPTLSSYKTALIQLVVPLPQQRALMNAKKRDRWFFFSLARPHRTATINHQKGGEADALLDGRAKAQLSYYEVTITPPSAVVVFGWSGSPTTQQPTGELYRSSCAEQRPKAQGTHNELRLELEPPQQQQEEGKEDKSRRR